MLTDEQVRQYREEGCLVFEALIQGERLACYKQVFDELVAKGRKLTGHVPHWGLELDNRGEPRAGLLHKVQGVCVVDARVLELVREPEIVDRVAVLIGENIDVFGTRFFPKLPDGGTSTDWHQDNYYFGTDTDRIVSCGIYLEDADEENGCLRVVPGSHRMGEIVEHRSEINRHGSWTQTVDESKAVDLAGYTPFRFLKTQLIRSSFQNRTDNPKRRGRQFRLEIFSEEEVQILRCAQHESVPFLQGLVVGSKSTMVVIANIFVTFQYGIQDGLRK